jgi:DnaJ-class molecular chaperone
MVNQTETDIKMKKDKWYTFLLHCSKHEKYVLEENGIVPCDAKGCNNGLTGVVITDNIQSWDGGYCKKCNGYGYIFKESEMFTHKSCPGCNGRGCFHCEGKGVIDWVTYIQLKAKLTRIF